MNRDGENNASFLKKFDAGIDVGGQQTQKQELIILQIKN